MQNIDLSIIIPCLNEEKTLPICIGKAREFFKNAGVQGEIIVGDNGSTDNSIELAENLADSVLHVNEKGYGNVLRELIKASNGKYIIMGDADDSYDFLKLENIYQSLISGNQLVIGNRFLGGIEKNAMPVLNQYLGNPIISFLGRKLYNVPINDFNCGLRGFERNAINQLKFKSKGMEFASEMIIKAQLNGLKLAEVPVKLFPDGRNGASHLRPFRDGFRHLKILFALRFQHRTNS